jgi:hypothetical protein
MSRPSNIVDLNIFDSFNFFPAVKQPSLFSVKPGFDQPYNHVYALLDVINTAVCRVAGDSVAGDEAIVSDDGLDEDDSCRVAPVVPEYKCVCYPSQVDNYLCSVKYSPSGQQRFSRRVALELDKAFSVCLIVGLVVSVVVHHYFTVLVVKRLILTLTALTSLILSQLVTIEKNPGPGPGEYTCTIIAGSPGPFKPLVVEYNESGEAPTGTVFHLTLQEYIDNFFGFFFKRFRKLANSYVLDLGQPYVSMELVVPGDAGGYVVGTFNPNDHRVTRYCVEKGVKSVTRLNFPLDIDLVVDVFNGGKFNFDFKVTAIFQPLEVLINKDIAIVTYGRYFNVVRTGVKPEFRDDPKKLLSELRDMKVSNSGILNVCWKVFKNGKDRTEISEMQREVNLLRLELDLMKKSGKAGSSMAVDVAKASKRLGVRRKPDATHCACGSTSIGNFCGDCGAKITGPGSFVPIVGEKKEGAKAPQNSPVCSCGCKIVGNFCGDCGLKAGSAKKSKNKAKRKKAAASVKENTGVVPVASASVAPERKVVPASSVKQVKPNLHVSFTNIFNAYKKQTGKGDEDIAMVRKLYKQYEKEAPGDLSLFKSIGLVYDYEQ